jgi:hypothetical protein
MSIGSSRSLLRCHKSAQQKVRKVKEDLPFIGRSEKGLYFREDQVPEKVVILRREFMIKAAVVHLAE